MGVLDRGRHQFRRLAAGITEHDALIARTVFIHALRDMSGLFVQVVVNLDLFPMEFLLLVADVLDASPHDVFDTLDHLGGLFLGRKANFTADNHPVGGGERLTRHTRVRLFGQEGIEDGI